MPFLTKKELVVKPILPARELNDFFERRNGNITEPKTVFLFYALADQDFVQPIVNILKSLRINVYVDFVDQYLLEDKNGGVTGILKERIEKADKVIFLSTPEGKEIVGTSNDYGLNGSLKNTGKVVVFPVTRMAMHWENQDNFNKFGFISKKFTLFNFPDDWMIQFPDGMSMSLKNWILM